MDMMGQHSHCLLCRQVNCKQFVDNVTSCEMTTCQDCAFRFHSCKTEEHALTCQQCRVPCVNAGNGCPLSIKRSQMAKHLPVCPASVISCYEQWCRWPMHAPEKGIRHSLPPSKTYIDCGQLDVGLAMRDQRMLLDSLKAPKKLKNSLRNPLTQKYPAAPFPAASRGSSIESDQGASGDTSQTVSDDESGAPWASNRLHPGLKEIFCSHLFKMKKTTTDEMATALNSLPNTISDKEDESEGEDKDGDDKDAVISDLSNGTLGNTEDSQAYETVNREMARSSISSERVSESRSRSVSILRDLGGTQLHRVLGEKLVEGDNPEISLRKVLGVNLTHELINNYQKKPYRISGILCHSFLFIPLEQALALWGSWPKNVHEEIHPCINGWMQDRCPLSYLGCTFSFSRLVPQQENTVLHHSWLQESFGLKSLAQPLHPHRDAENAPSHPDSSLCQHQQQNSATNENTIASDKQQHVPSISDLGNFDQAFDSPITSVKNDSNFGLNDFPPISCDKNDSHIAKDGVSTNECQSSKQRDPMMSVRPIMFTSADPESKVLFHYDVEENSTTDDLFVDLPFEVLQLIAKKLDSFSLCNLALTCRKLREVCCSLLDFHGIVVLNWKREKNGDKVSWKVANKRWMFSTSFEPIKSWRFNPDQPSMGEHLKTCPFNKDVNTHTHSPKVMMFV